MAFCKKPEKLSFMKKIIVRPNDVVMGIIVRNPKTKHVHIYYYDEEENKEITNLLTTTDL